MNSYGNKTTTRAARAIRTSFVRMPHPTPVSTRRETTWLGLGSVCFASGESMS
jgi:hypothetical protein